MRSQIGNCYIIGDWRVSPDKDRISDGSTIHHLEPKCMQVLVGLAEHANEVVSRQALLEEVWPEAFSGDDALTRCICQLRGYFGDDPHQPEYIQTIPKKGYRLIATCRATRSVKETPQFNIWTARQPLLILIVICVGAGWVFSSLISLGTPSSQLSNPPIPARVVEIPANSISVLPFRNLSGNPAYDSFSQGISTTIRSVVAQQNDLGVVSYAPANNDQLGAADIRTIGAKIGVSKIVTGSVQQSGHTLRITVHLLDCATGVLIWSKTYDFDGDSPFKIQDEIAQSVVFHTRASLADRDPA